MKLFIRTAALAAAASLVAVPALADHHGMKKPASTVVDAAIASPDHKTLVKAVVAADLAGTLSGPGPFTVFAPTDAAFAAVPAATLASLLEPANKPALTKVLTFHVVPGKVKAADLIKLINDNGGTTSVATVQGGSLTFTLEGGKVKVTGANGSQAFVTATDVKGSNGVIHVVDGVLLPA